MHLDQLSLDTTTFIQNKQVKCCNGKKASHACINNSCDNCAFLCINQNCRCKQVHQDCGFSITLQKMQKMLENKIGPLKQIGNIIQIQIYKAIDQLSDFGEKIKIDLQKYSGFNELTDKQSLLLKVLKYGEVHSIQGNHIFLIQQSLKKQSVNQYLVAQKNIKRYWDQFYKQIQHLKTSIIQGLFKNNNAKLEQTKNLQNKVNIKQLKNSSILKTNSQVDRLKKFFEQNIQTAELIYRASRDSFKASKFNENCDNIPNTLTIVQTKKGRIFGGYTPVTGSSAKCQFVCDNELKSFIFQLNENDKFKLKPGKIAIQKHSSFGPLFGEGYDIAICDDSNVKEQSWAYFGSSYQNCKYKSFDAKSQDKFSGGNMFTVKDYEVWKIKFC